MRCLPVVALLCVASMAHAEKWCFVVAGDGRSDPKAARPMDRGGVNATITTEVMQAVIKENAKFLAWTGDLVYGYQNDPAAFERQLLTWRGIMQPLYDRHIGVLPCRGNHDASSKDAVRIWNKVFSGGYNQPKNGPSTPGDLSWYFTCGDVLFVGLDQYGGELEAIDQNWFDSVLKQNPKKFVFAMGHEPAFMDGAHTDTMDAHPEKRDAFWESLIRSGSRAFFAGHDHIYDHMSVLRQGAKPGVEMHQFVAGTSGAPFYGKGSYKGKNSYWSVNRVANIANTYGYMLVTVDGSRCTIEFKGRKSPGQYVTMDSWSYQVP